MCVGDLVGVCGKFGNGYGYGVGFRVDLFLGLLWLEYVFNDCKVCWFYFGIGYRNWYVLVYGFVFIIYLELFLLF